MNAGTLTRPQTTTGSALSPEATTTTTQSSDVRAHEQQRQRARAAAPARSAASACRGSRAQASPSVSRRPTAAAAVTWAIIPVTRISAEGDAARGRPRATRSTPTSPTSSASLALSVASSERSSVTAQQRGDDHRDQPGDRGDQDRRPDGGLGVEPDDAERRVVHVAEAERPQRHRAGLVRRAEHPRRGRPGARRGRRGQVAGRWRLRRGVRPGVGRRGRRGWLPAGRRRLGRSASPRVRHASILSGAPAQGAVTLSSCAGRVRWAGAVLTACALLAGCSDDEPDGASDDGSGGHASMSIADHCADVQRDRRGRHRHRS